MLKKLINTIKFTRISVTITTPFRHSKHTIWVKHLIGFGPPIRICEEVKKYDGVINERQIPKDGK